MTESIYDRYLAGGDFCEALVQKIRDLAINADLDSRDVTIGRRANNAKDDAELYADRYAQRMVANPGLIEKIKYGVRLYELADPDNKGFLTERNGSSGVLTLRASNVIRGILAVVQGKLERRVRRESRIGRKFSAVAQETSSTAQSKAESEPQNPGLDLPINYPIDRTMHLYNLNEGNVRPLLDLNNCDSKTVLELLVAKAFTEELPKPPDNKVLDNEARKRSRQRRTRVKNAQTTLDC